MGKSRREFIKRGAVTALAVGLPATLVKSVSANSIGVLLGQTDQLAKTTFARYLNTKFRAQASGSRPVDLKLIKISEIAGNKKAGFSLLFDGARDKVLSQDIYSFQHDEMGKFSLLLVPVVTRRRNQPHYEVIINKLH
ncbi:MAG: hypothetical protein QOE77_597 [Blastocatellia bacterium]|jgi:hypothetical protein|nr:hypothetical protein [Blastocatellia bacterium]